MSSRSSIAPSFHRRRSSRASVVSSISAGDGEANGLGSLADELGEIWDQEELEGQGSSFLDGLREGSIDPVMDGPLQSPNSVTDMRYFSTAGTSQTPISPSSATFQPLTPAVSEPGTQEQQKSSTHRKTESRNDVLDHVPDSDNEDPTDIPPSLAKRLRDIEKVTRMSSNTEDSLSEDGGVVYRTTQALKELGPQSSIENGTSRLITAYTSMATHRTHTARELFSQTHSLLYGQSASANLNNLPEEVIDLLLYEISELSSALSPTSSTSTISNPPQTPTQQSPLLSLELLASDTSSLLQTLRGLTDSLTEWRQVHLQATRKLRSARDLAEEIRLEEELKETSMLLIQAGDWDRRCRERHAARTCREVVTGFSKTCDVLRDRYVRRWESTGVDGSITTSGGGGGGGGGGKRSRKGSRGLLEVGVY